MNAYILAKTLHVSCVVLSLCGFSLRGGLMLARSPLLDRRIVRIAPHIVDTLLLASALWLCALIGQWPFRDGWLTAKVLGLVAYIVLGAIALRRGRTPAARAVAFVLALAAAGYIVSVALTHDARGALAWLASG